MDLDEINNELEYNGKRKDAIKKNTKRQSSVNREDEEVKFDDQEEEEEYGTPNDWLNEIKNEIPVTKPRCSRENSLNRS